MNPNILIVVEDALRADRVGVLGERNLTPNLDRLADQSAVFTRAFSTTNATDSAITSIQTGRHPLSHGIVNHGRRITDQEKSTIQNVQQLPEVLSEAGYRTAKFGRPLGRWHRSGFDIYPETGEWRNSFEKSQDIETRISKRLDSIDPRIQKTASAVYSATVERLKKFALGTEQNTDIGRRDVVDELATFIEADDPWFAFVHLMDTHTPYEAEMGQVKHILEEHEYRNKPLEEVAEKFPNGSHSHDRLVEGGNVYEFVEQWEDTEYGIGTAVVDAHYDATVKQADDRIGRIHELLEERGVLDETIVVVLSDHGESLTEHGIYYDHHGLYDESIHVPLFIRPPGGISTVCDELVQITDIAPTVLDYTGIDGLSDADGQSLQNTIHDGESIDREFVLADEAHTQRRRMIRTQNKKLIYDVAEDTTCRYCEIQHAPEEELFELNNDPDETENCVSREEQTVDQLRTKAEKAARELKSRSPAQTGSEAIRYDDEEEIHERLEALGYR
jgi:arylsulfatase A-like enzyme